MRFENKAGGNPEVVKHRGRDRNHYDLYDIRHLTLGQMQAIHTALIKYVADSESPVAKDVLDMLDCPVFGIIDTKQTIGGK